MTNPSSIGEPAASTRPSPSPSSLEPGARLASLDAFRGLTIAAMLLVNNPGSWSHIYPPLAHAEWNGWTPTDLIFPFFLFIVGVSMEFSLGRQRERGASTRALLGSAARRSAVLFALGLVLQGFPAYDLATLRIPGVLQRIALAYALAVPVVLLTRPRAQAILGGVILLGYWLIQTRAPLPGGGISALQPGADLGAWIDRAVFGEAHLWGQSRTWDPEGLLSTLPAMVTVLCGAFVGRWLRSGRPPADTMAGLVLAGVAGLAAGLAWNSVHPINKNLWTGSYVLFTAGFACQLLAICYWLIEVRGRHRWAAPFLVFGTNAIAAFFLSSLFARVLGLVRVPSAAGSIPLKSWLWEHIYSPLAAPRLASLAFALTYVCLWLAVLAVLYRRRIFLKV